MATCPECNGSSRDNPDLMTLYNTGRMAVAGPANVAGVQVKTAAVPVYRLECRCGWHILGRIDGDHLVKIDG